MSYRSTWHLAASAVLWLFGLSGQSMAQFESQKPLKADSKALAKAMDLLEKKKLECKDKSDEHITKLLDSIDYLVDFVMKSDLRIDERIRLKGSVEKAIIAFAEGKLNATMDQQLTALLTARPALVEKLETEMFRRDR